MKTKRTMIITVFLIFAGISIMAQTAEKPWAVGLNFGKNEFVGKIGDASFFKSGQNFYLDLGFFAQTYAYRDLDFSFNINYGKIGYKLNDIEVFNGNVYQLGLRAIYKFYNGYLLKEDAMFGPYLIGGVGLEKNWGTEAWEKNASVMFPLGAGLRINITEAFSVRLQSVLNFCVHNKLSYAGNENGGPMRDKFYTHSIGIAYAFKSLCGSGQSTVKAPPPLPVAAPVVSEETRKIFEEALQGVQFETGKDVIKPESFPILNQVVKVMNDNPSYRLEINGHTDNQGKPAMNMDLSNKRAIAVRNYLADKGIKTNRLKPQGFGETKPIADNTTPEGRAKNRRVEFKVY
jgi:outer membrane protein OmpA-like peptidoglycan-associated protein